MSLHKETPPSPPLVRGGARRPHPTSLYQGEGRAAAPERVASAPMYDVIVAGYGPTGMLAAILLGRAGHKVCVLERYSTLYNLPRVGIVHDDVQRMFQEVGILDRVRAKIPNAVVVWDSWFALA